MTATANKPSFIADAWLVLVLGLLFGAGLAGMQIGLSGRIELNKKMKIYHRLPELVPGGTDADESTLKADTGAEYRVYHVKDAQGAYVGWVLRDAGLGFGDKIELLVGLNPSLTTISGLSVLDQKETPGLGDNITKPAFRDRFKGSPTTAPLAVVKLEPTKPGEILAVTGATISSRSVVGIVNAAIAACKPVLLAPPAKAKE